MKKFAIATSLLFLAALLHAETAGVIQLPQPDLKSGKPLMQCAAERRSERKFSEKALPAQMISEKISEIDLVVLPNSTDTCNGTSIIRLIFSLPATGFTFGVKLWNCAG